jgi:hypothetical protein
MAAKRGKGEKEEEIPKTPAVEQMSQTEKMLYRINRIHKRIQ